MFDERAIVAIERKVTRDRKIRTFYQRIHDARLFSALSNTQQDALCDLDTAKRILTGSLGVRTANYSGVSGMSTEENIGWQIDLEGHFKDWCARMKGKGVARLVAELVAEGWSCAAIASNKQMSYPKVLRLLKQALNEFADIRGYGEEKKVKIPPTKYQWELLQLIAEFQAANQGVSPTLQELADTKRVHKSAIEKMVKRMGERCLLSYVPARPRSIVLLV